VIALRLEGNPVIRPEMFSNSDGGNINGPSLIRAPDWLHVKLGNFYLYFGHHQGEYIRMAYADRLEGPWSIYKGGVLRLAAVPRASGHLASPDVVVLNHERIIRMYFHTYLDNKQKTLAAISKNGLLFEVRAGPVLGKAYFKAIQWRQQWVGIASDGRLYGSPDGIKPYIPIDNAPCIVDKLPKPNASLRHCALRGGTNWIEIYYTLIGDCPERVWRCRISVTDDGKWVYGPHEIILEPKYWWEGAELPKVASKKGMALAMENGVRDPAIVELEANAFITYAVAGEAGIGVALLEETSNI